MFGKLLRELFQNFGVHLCFDDLSDPEFLLVGEIAVFHHGQEPVFFGPVD
jgi:hypothetical protein